MQAQASQQKFFARRIKNIVFTGYYTLKTKSDGVVMAKNDGKDLIAISYAVAVALAEGKTADEISVISQIFMIIGDTLGLMAAKMQLCENLESKP